MGAGTENGDAVIRKIFILALGLVALMALPAAAQYENPTTTTTSPTTTSTTTVTTTQPGETTSTTVVAPSTTVGTATTEGPGVDANNGNQGQGGGTLVRTGSDTENLLKIGGVLLVAGGAITLVAGKRRRQAE